MCLHQAKWRCFSHGSFLCGQTAVVLNSWETYWVQPVGQPISQWQQLWMQHFHTLSIWTWFHPLHRPISLIGNLTGILQHCIKTEGPRTPIYSALLPGIKEAKVPFKSFNMMEVTVMLIPSAGSRSQVVFRRMTGGLATSEGQRRLIAPGRRFARHAFLIGPKAPCSTV